MDQNQRQVHLNLCWSQLRLRDGIRREPVLTATSAVDQDLVGSARVPGQASSSLGRARDSAQGLQERQALYNMEVRHGRLQAQPNIDTRSVVAQATASVANMGDFATMTEVAEASGTWTNPLVRGDLPVTAGPPVVHGGHGPFWTSNP